MSGSARWNRSSNEPSRTAAKDAVAEVAVAASRLRRNPRAAVRTTVQTRTRHWRESGARSGSGGGGRDIEAPPTPSLPSQTRFEPRLSVVSSSTCLLCYLPIYCMLLLVIGGVYPTTMTVAHGRTNASSKYLNLRHGWRLGRATPLW